MSESATLARIAEVAWAWLEDTVAEVSETEPSWWPPSIANSTVLNCGVRAPDWSL